MNVKAAELQIQSILNLALKDAESAEPRAVCVTLVTQSGAVKTYTTHVQSPGALLALMGAVQVSASVLAGRVLERTTDKEIA